MLLDSLAFLHMSVSDILDIVLVALILYTTYRWIRGSSALNIFIAIILLLIVRILAVALNMKMISALLGTVIDVGVVAIIVIFQPEIRRFLSNLGRRAGKTLDKNSILGRIFHTSANKQSVSNNSASEIARACEVMSKQKCGALILIMRRDRLAGVVETGDVIDARISRRLIQNIFFKNSPLHDGAMVIGDDRIIAARCTLPITERKDIPPKYGMRHKAAIGISEQCDVDVIVVSEETGGISFVRGGELSEVEGINALNLLIGNTTE